MLILLNDQLVEHPSNNINVSVVYVTRFYIAFLQSFIVTHSHGDLLYRIKLRTKPTLAAIVTCNGKSILFKLSTLRYVVRYKYTVIVLQVQVVIKQCRWCVIYKTSRITTHCHVSKIYLYCGYLCINTLTKKCIYHETNNTSIRPNSCK